MCRKASNAIVALEAINEPPIYEGVDNVLLSLSIICGSTVSPNKHRIVHCGNRPTVYAETSEKVLLFGAQLRSVPLRNALDLLAFGGTPKYIRIVNEIA